MSIIMKKTTMPFVCLCVLFGGVSLSCEEKPDYYAQAIEVYKTKDTEKIIRFWESLSLAEILTLSKQACPATIDLNDSSATHAASWSVNLSLQVARKYFPKQILDLCLKEVQSSKETTLWRCEVLRWLRSIYTRDENARKKGSTDEEFKRILSVCTKLAFSRKEHIKLRLRAIGNVARMLSSRSRSGFYKNKAFQKAIKEDSDNQHRAIGAARKAGFRNPWENHLVKASKKLLAAIADPTEDPKFLLAAFRAFFEIQEYRYSTDAVKNVLGRLKKILADKSTPTNLAICAGWMVYRHSRDQTILDEIKERLKDAQEEMEKIQKNLTLARKNKDTKAENKAIQDQRQPRLSIDRCKHGEFTSEVQRNADGTLRQGFGS